MNLYGFVTWLRHDAAHAMAKPRTRSAAAPQKASPSTPLQFRFPTHLVAELDDWTERLNQGRFWPPLTRADVVRGVLQWALQHQPDWAGQGPVGARAKPQR
jgi:hypothetical protein